MLYLSCLQNPQMEMVSVQLDVPVPSVGEVRMEIKMWESSV